jgi:hypothetical protein
MRRDAFRARGANIGVARGAAAAPTIAETA